MKALTTILMATGVVLLPLLAHAQGIGRISTDNRSDANTSYEIGFGSFEFQTWATFSDPVLHGRTASFSHRMAWYGGLFTENSIPIIGIGGAESAEVAYLLRFRVFDPGAAGYTLQVQSQLIGGLYARAGGANDSRVDLSAFSVSVDDGSGAGSSFVDLPALATSFQSVFANTTPADAFSLVDDRGRSRVGDYFGTQDFVLAVRGDPHALTTLASGGQAQSHMQFGRAPTLTALQDGLYTGPGGTPINDLGHFLNVSVEFAPTPAVPEPGSWALLAAGLGLLLGRQCRSPRAEHPAS